MADPTATASTRSTSPPSRSGPAPPLRSQTSQVRIDGILETARRRSIVLGDPITRVPMTLSPEQSMRIAEHETTGGDGHESSADEHTAIVQRESTKRSDYQSTSTSVKSRNSQQATRRPGPERRTQPAPSRPEVEEENSWWKKQLEKLGSIELENKGSVARDHLALERTFLAWLRTSLAFASIGIAVTQLFRLNTSISGSPSSGDDPYQHLRQLGKPLGATFLGISIVTLSIGFHRYFESQHWIIRGKFPASRGSVAAISAIALALMVTSLIVVLVVGPTAFEKRRR